MARSGKSITDLIKTLFFYAVISGLCLCVCISVVIVAVDTKISTNAHVIDLNEKLNRSFPLLIDAYRFGEKDAMAYILDRMNQVLAPSKVHIEEKFSEKCQVETYSLGEWKLCWGVTDVVVSRLMDSQTALVYKVKPMYFVGSFYRAGFYILGAFVVVIYCLLFFAFRSIWKKILGPIGVLHRSMLNEDKVINDANSDLREMQSLKAALSGVRQAAHNEAVVRTISMVFHDVMKPFAVLKGSLTSLGQAKTFADFVQEYPRVVSQVARATRKAEVLMQEISDYSSSLQLDLKPCAVESIVKESLGEVSDFFNSPSLKIQLNWQHRNKVLCDEFRLQRVISNILVNACQATKLKGRIWIQTRQDDSRTFILIGNSGSFIPSSSISKLFQYRFTQGKTRGTGLGLAIAQHIVEAHGGKINVINSPEKNQVEFEFDIGIAAEEEVFLKHQYEENLSLFGSRIEQKPFAQQGEVSSVVLAADVSEEKLPKQRDAIKILVIDDDPLDREHVRQSIIGRGLVEVFRVLECDDPENLDDVLIQSTKIFVVDLDLGIDALDGCKVIALLRKARGNKAFIFACSNRSDSNSVSNAWKAGANAFIAKPFSIDKLLKSCLNGDQSHFFDT
jgi:signal transduction histidine kinase/ActR/RegA family two-component response regulator